MLVGIFRGPRASEGMGFQWKSWTGLSLMPYGIAVEGQLYEGRLKTKASRAPIAVPEPVHPAIEAWRRICPDPSPEALMFPTSVAGSGNSKLCRDTQRTSSSCGFVRSLSDHIVYCRLQTFRSGFNACRTTLPIAVFPGWLDEKAVR